MNGRIGARTGVPFMIDRFSASWKEACELIEYTYAEDLEGWACPDDGIIDIHSPVLDRLSPGDVVCMNAINYSYFLLFGMLRPAILDYTPFAMLSCNEKAQEFQNRMLFSFLSGEYESDEKLLDRLSTGSILSKRLRAKRLCEVEDELEVLSAKGFKVVTISYGADFPYLDAESREKGYADHYDAFGKVAVKYGLSLIVFTSSLPRNLDGVTTLKVWPERNRLILAPPEAVTVTVNGGKQYRFHIENDSRIIAGFSIRGRKMFLVRKDS